jgi:hypothetical protein
LPAVYILIALEDVFSYLGKNLSEFKAMEIKLSEQEKQELERRHRTEPDGRVCDRIKAVLLKSECWTN